MVFLWTGWDVGWVEFVCSGVVLFAYTDVGD